MEIKLIDIDNKEHGNLTLDEAIFGTSIRDDIIHRVVMWQLAKRRAGTHQTKTISMVSGTGKKPYKQKGTGRARQGSLRSAQFRGGATMFGPQNRDYTHSLPKKVRKLGLKISLAAKFASGNFHVIKDLNVDAKTKLLVSKLEKLNVANALFIDNEQVPENFKKAANNIANIDYMPQIGANVYDIMNHDKLIITEAALKALCERL